MFFKSSYFEFTSVLESNWKLIRQELEQLHKEKFIPWTEKFLYREGWEVFGLYAFGNKLENNCQLCPTTVKLIETIPGMTTAGFSVLNSGVHVIPHIGYTKAVLRCHLGLIVPDGCFIRVGKQLENWQEGKCLIFDDTIEHEAWNHADTARTILLIDFKKPRVLCPRVKK